MYKRKHGWFVLLQVTSVLLQLNVYIKEFGQLETITGFSSMKEVKTGLLFRKITLSPLGEIVYWSKKEGSKTSQETVTVMWVRNDGVHGDGEKGIDLKGGRNQEDVENVENRVAGSSLGMGRG